MSRTIRPAVDQAHAEALVEYVKRATESPAEEIHYMPGSSAMSSACGIDIYNTSYAYGSTERVQVDCAACQAVMPPGDDPVATTYAVAITVEGAACTHGLPAVTGLTITAARALETWARGNAPQGSTITVTILEEKK